MTAFLGEREVDVVSFFFFQWKPTATSFVELTGTTLSARKKILVDFFFFATVPSLVIDNDR